MLGRGLRPSPGKDHCLYLDHAGNLTRLGYPDDPLPTELCMKKSGVSSKDKRDKGDPLPWNCDNCHAINHATDQVCGKCGAIRARSSKVITRDERLVALTGGSLSDGRPDKQKVFAMLVYHQRKFKYSAGWSRQKYNTLFGEFPRGPQPRPVEPTKELKSWIRSEQIRYAKRYEKQRKAS